MTRESVWTKDEEKSFENAIALHWNGEESEEQWEKAASMVPTKTTDELKQYYQLLVEDVSSIEAGRVTIPNYAVEEANSSYKDHHRSDKRSNCGYASGLPSLAHDSVAHGVKGALKSEKERRKGIPWTEEEHRMFLLGLDKFGKGDWRSISRNFVMSRTPTQVASHAQKYFIRLNSMNRDRRRSSIHDITSVNNGDISSHQPPITGAGAAVHPPPAKHGAQPHTTGLGMCRTPVGHPLGLPASAVGTPVMLPPGHHPQNMSTNLKI